MSSEGAGSGGGDGAGRKHPSDGEDLNETVKRLKKEIELANKRAEQEREERIGAGSDSGGEESTSGGEESTSCGGDGTGRKHSSHVEVEDLKETVKRLKKEVEKAKKAAEVAKKEANREANDEAELVKKETELANKKIELANKEIELANKEIEQARKERIKERKERIKEREERIKIQKLMAGTYYTQFSDLWECKAEEFSEADMKTFQRTKLPSFSPREFSGKGNPSKPYELTIENAFSNDTALKDDGVSARTSHSKKNIQNFLWPCDVLGNDLPEQPSAKMSASSSDQQGEQSLRTDADMDRKLKRMVHNFQQDPNFEIPDTDHPLYKNTDESTEKYDPLAEVVHGEVGHLVPASPLRASLYIYVAKWVFAITEEDIMNNHQAIQKAIHGSVEKGDTKRIPSTGLKHLAANKIRLRNQRAYFDDTPNVLIIPAMPLEKLLNWDGTGYNALFLVGDQSKKKRNLEPIVSGVRLTDVGNTAGEEDIELGRSLLENAVLSLAESLHQLYSCRKSLPGFKDKHKEEIRKLHQEFVAGMKVALQGDWGEKKVFVPRPNSNVKHPKVRMITFVDQFGHGHPAPDPLLLLVKAAINWSKFHDFPLLVAGEPEEERDELSVLAEEEFYEMQQSARRNQMAQDVIGMTIGGKTMS